VVRHSHTHTIDNIKEDINFYMPAVENETLLLCYHSIVESKLKFLFGSGDSVQKMFVLLSEACGEFQKLQKGACTKSQRHASTSIILQNLNEIVTQINNKQIQMRWEENPFRGSNMLVKSIQCTTFLIHL
jgi:hypothetical protein